MNAKHGEFEELLRLLSSGTWSDKQIKDATKKLAQAYEHPLVHVTQEPDDVWLVEGVEDDHDYCGEVLLRWVLFKELDELILQAEAMIDIAQRAAVGARVPSARSWPATWNWVNQVLAKEGAEHGGLQVLQYDEGASDEVHVLKVRRNDVKRILELAKKSGLKIHDPAIAA